MKRMKNGKAVRRMKGTSKTTLATADVVRRAWTPDSIVGSIQDDIPNYQAEVPVHASIVCFDRYKTRITFDWPSDGGWLRDCVPDGISSPYPTVYSHVNDFFPGETASYRHKARFLLPFVVYVSFL